MSIVTEKSFNSALTIIKKSGESLAQAIHEAGCFAINQANIHGNIGFGVRLMEAIGRKHDAKRVEKWLCTFGKFGMKAGELVYRKRKDIHEENYAAALEKANSTPYWELTQQEHCVFTVDYLAGIKSLVAKHDKAESLRGEGKEADEKNVAILDEVKAILARYTVPAAVAA